MDRHLLLKFFRSECTTKEVIEILTWVNSFESKQQFEQEFKMLWQQAQFPYQLDWEKAFKELHEKMEMERLIKTLPISSDTNDLTRLKEKGTEKLHRNYATRYYSRIAWVFITFVMVGVVAYLAQYQHQAVPVQQEEIVEYLIKETEAGQKLTLHLEDGSKVILNAESKLKFPKHFGDESRRVSLDGEAYFEVVGDSLRPFTVKAGILETIVLGTSFNISAYQNEQIHEIALAEGQVKILKSSSQSDEMILEPGEKVSYHTDNGSMDKSNLDPLQSFAWKDGIIFFENADFKEIKSTLERWYGVNFIIEGNAYQEKWEFSGKFKNQSLKNILEALSFSHDFTYSIQHKKITLTFI